jgi:hypothetical protein
VERMDCKSIVVVKKSVLRTVQIFIATSRDSCMKRKARKGQHGVEQRHTDMILIFDAS